MIYSFSPFGYEGSLVSVEVDLRRGIPATDIVGIADGAVKESRERMQSAIRNSGYEYPNERVLISLSPADLKKEGGGFDLPIALAVLSAKDDFPRSQNAQVLVMGELELSGKVRPVKGCYPALSTAQAAGIKYAILPKGTEKAVPKGIKVAYVDSLSDAYNALVAIEENNEYGDIFENTEEEQDMKIEFDDYGMNIDNVEGMYGLKYAMTVAVAGHHNILAWGEHGCRKTFTLQHMPEIMPKLLPDEQKSTTRIWSLAGLMKPDNGYLKTRPFRMPHQTASLEGICGGGSNCRPGEISLAHNGVLFLDESAEFRSSVLQMLRVPIENKTITLCRAGRTTVYPANFQLVMATAPCPCGWYGSHDKHCLCSPKSIEQYWMKFSAPLLDRIGIRYNCNEDDSMFPKYTRDEMREHIKLAWERQYARQGKLNQDLTVEELNKYVSFTVNAHSVLVEGCDKKQFSPRETAQILKIAQTLLDMEFSPSEKITELEIKMALELHKAIPLYE